MSSRSGAVGQSERDANMKIRIGLVASFVVACTYACSGPEPEPQRAVEQPLDTLTCEHALCATGEKLSAACDPCAELLCASDPYCCAETWDATCVGEVASICGKSCDAPPPAEDAGPSTCAHPVCASGGPLVSGCSPCATSLCAQDPYCCAVAWDATCVGEVASFCAQGCN